MPPALPDLGARRSGGSGDLRHGNLTQILRYVRDHGPSSRHHIARGCGLGISTMTDLIGELRSRGLLRELDPIRRPGAGRPTRPIDFDGEAWCVLGVQLDIDQAEFVATTMGGRVLWEERRSVQLGNAGAEAGYAAIAALLTDQLQRIPPATELIAIEVGVPGFVARDEQTVSRCESFDWTDFALHTAIEKTLADLGLDGVHVGVANSSHLAALYAARIELGLPSDSIVAYFGGDRTVSTGLVVDGEIFRGATGGAGEFGVSGVDPAALLVASGLLDEATARREVAECPVDAVKRLLDAAAGDDATTVATLAQAGTRLGEAADVLIGVVNPHAVVLGGFLAALSDYLLPAVQERLADRLQVEVYSPTTIVAVDAGVSREVGGAVLAARDACFYDPLALTRPLR